LEKCGIDGWCEEMRINGKVERRVARGEEKRFEFVRKFSNLQAGTLKIEERRASTGR
jgi:hypothetical protein